MTTLMVGTDFSERSDRAVRRALILARQGNFDLLLVHVVKAVSAKAKADRSLEIAEARLNDTARQIQRRDDVRCECQVRLGVPEEQLGEVARDADAQLILIGRHRQSLLRDRFLQTTASRIIRRIRLPLIVVNRNPADVYQCVMVPSDFRDASRRAAATADALAFLDTASKILLHVYDAPAREMFGRTFMLGAERENYLSEVAGDARQRLTRFAAEVGWAANLSTVAEERGSIANEILRVGDERQADLIIVSRNNKGPLEEAVIGSVTETLLRKSRFDLLVVPQNGTSADPGVSP